MLYSLRLYEKLVYRFVDIVGQIYLVRSIRTARTGRRLPVLGGTYHAVDCAAHVGPLQGKWHVPALFVY